MNEIKDYLNNFGEFLDIDQQAFFDYAEDYLGSEDYYKLVDMLKESGINLSPKDIFNGYDTYKLTHNIKEFILDNFIKDINDFNNFDIKDLTKDKEIFYIDKIFTQ